MYFIKKITIDATLRYQSSMIVDHTNKKISTAILLLENSVRSFVKDECGREAGEKIKIIDIHNIDQVNEPPLDSVLLYRLTENPHRVIVYQKKTTINKVKGWAWGESDTVVTSFRQTHLFELEEYVNLNCNVPSNPNIQIQVHEEMISTGPSGIKIPKQMTLAPICNLLDELRKSPKFVERANSSANPRLFKTTIITAQNKPTKEINTTQPIIAKQVAPNPTLDNFTISDLVDIPPITDNKIFNQREQDELNELLKINEIALAKLLEIELEFKEEIID